jgi:hypothetical protein
MNFGQKEFSAAFCELIKYIEDEVETERLLVEWIQPFASHNVLHLCSPNKDIHEIELYHMQVAGKIKTTELEWKYLKDWIKMQGEIEMNNYQTNEARVARLAYNTVLKKMDEIEQKQNDKRR